jgi:site-specific DNA-cytosine methylase
MVDKKITMQDILEDGYATNEMTSQDGKSHCLTARYNGAVWWNSIERKQRTMVLKDNPTMSKDGLIRVGTADLKGHDSIRRVYAQEGKAPTLTTMQGGHREPKVATSGDMWRKLTPLECERLQTLPDNYTNHVSNSQRYKMIGNGWTVDVIAHILKTMDVEKQYLLTDPIWDKRWTKENV